MYTSAGIDRVRVFGIASGFGENGPGRNLPFAVLVKWRSCHGDKLHQVYVNGRLAGVTSDSFMRQVIVGVPVCMGGSIRVEVVAVEPGEGQTEFDISDFCGAQDGRVRLSWVRTHGLPYGGRYEIYIAEGEGKVEFDAEPMDCGTIWDWACDKAGFGLGAFGEEDFGWDSGTACGFGLGSFGGGEFGLDADEVVWVSEELATGKYKFGVRFLDAAGFEVGRFATDGVVVVRRCRGVKNIDLIEADAGLLQFAIN